ncbi:hypothetical protein C1H46_032282 [Malus baccata]|uniref:Uncharacterized protein n=1 Tax=Malus baccata TaxID=106549 RepID=A0A540L6V3_MALBA|nr:hypothetical protein C1H46_032282 [Malus baccata]
MVMAYSYTFYLLINVVLLLNAKIILQDAQVSSGKFIMLIGIIESSWHAYIHVVCSSLLHLGVSACPWPGPVLHVYVHLHTAHSPWIQVGANPVVQVALGDSDS